MGFEFPSTLRCNGPVKSSPILLNGGAIIELVEVPSSVDTVEYSSACRSGTFLGLVLSHASLMEARIFVEGLLESFPGQHDLL